MDCKIQPLEFDEQRKVVSVIVIEYYLWFIKLPPRIVFSKYQISVRSINDRNPALWLTQWFYRDTNQKVDNGLLYDQLSNFAEGWATQKNLI